MTVFARCWYGLATIVYLLWLIFVLPHQMGSAHWVWGDLVWVALFWLFFLLYVLPFAVFGAEVRVTDSGIEVSQYGKTLVAFEEIRSCRSVLLFPFRFLLLITRRKFPLTVIICTDAQKPENPFPKGPRETAIRSKLAELRD